MRCERSTLPEHAGGNLLVLRVLKILDPIKPVDPHYDMRLPVPCVGSLILNSKGCVRSLNLDDGSNKTFIAFKNLPSLPDVEPNL